MTSDRKIFFWEHAAGLRPQDFVRRDVPRGKREQLAAVLRGGTRGLTYRGWAECRMCGAHLGSSDVHGLGFVWPELAEHYVLEHDVWTPGCDALYAASRSATPAPSAPANPAQDRLRHEGFVHGFVTARDPRTPHDILVTLEAAERAWHDHLASQEATRG